MTTSRASRWKSYEYVSGGGHVDSYSVPDSPRVDETDRRSNKRPAPPSLPPEDGEIRVRHWYFDEPFVDVDGLSVVVTSTVFAPGFPWSVVCPPPSIRSSLTYAPFDRPFTFAELFVRIAAELNLRRSRISPVSLLRDVRKLSLTSFGGTRDDGVTAGFRTDSGLPTNDRAWRRGPPGYAERGVVLPCYAAVRP